MKGGSSHSTSGTRRVYCLTTRTTSDMEIVLHTRHSEIGINKYYVCGLSIQMIFKITKNVTVENQIRRLNEILYIVFASIILVDIC